MAVSEPHERPMHEPTKRRLVWPNGAQAFTYSAAAPAQLRGPQHDAAWCDETAAWFDARKGDVLDTSWNNLMLGLRLGAQPQCFVTTTPKRVRLIREIMERKSTVITTDTTYANLKNLASSFREQVRRHEDRTSGVDGRTPHRRRRRSVAVGEHRQPASRTDVIGIGSGVTEQGRAA